VSAAVEQLVDQEQVDSFREDGAVALRGVFADWVETLRAGIERNIGEPGPGVRIYESDGGGGRFFGDYCNWDRIPEYRDFVVSSPAAAIAKCLMGSRTVRPFHEHVLVKEPGAGASRRVTPWRSTTRRCTAPRRTRRPGGGERLRFACSATTGSSVSAPARPRRPSVA